MAGAQPPDADGSRGGPLTGLRVIEAGDLGEVCGRLLAEAGAGVVRVEPPSGCRSRTTGPFAAGRPDVNGSLRFAYWNAGKRSVSLDLTRGEAEPLWRGLVAGADVVIDSLGPARLDALGLGYAGFGDQPRLVWCSITPFGLTGPWRDFQASDLVSLALGGPMMSSGYDDHDLPPSRPDGEHSLAMAGEYAAISVLTALWQRRATGLGQSIDLSVHECVSATTEGAFFNWEYSRQVVQRQTGRHAGVTPTAPWQVETADGRHVCLMGGGFPRDERVWSALLAWIDESGAGTEIEERDYSRVSREQRPRVVGAIQRFARSLPAETVYRRGQACHLPWGLVRRPEENLHDPHWDDRGFFTELELPGRESPVRMPAAPFRLHGVAVELQRPPLLGEHNFEVFGRELGLTAEQLAALAREGVV
jgi:crotonobetainyl-CoA:carnitine CoA-transferase CaiB-like acyl-CoA transferase